LVENFDGQQFPKRIMDGITAIVEQGNEWLQNGAFQNGTKEITG
jgi:hypothetical protein